jgi:Tat protein secretion system quality control protein TatD with DNase activity
MIVDIKGKNSQREFFRIVDRYPEMYERIMIHNSLSSPAEVCEFVSRGCWLGIDDRILNKMNFDMLVSIMLIPEGKMLLETGAPFTKINEGSRVENTPLNIKKIANEISKIVSCDEEQMKKRLLMNAEKFFSRN